MHVWAWEGLVTGHARARNVDLFSVMRVESVQFGVREGVTGWDVDGLG